MNTSEEQGFWLKGSLGGQVVPEVWHEVTEAAHKLVMTGRAPKRDPAEEQLREMATYIRYDHTLVFCSAYHGSVPSSASNLAAAF